MSDLDTARAIIAALAMSACLYVLAFLLFWVMVR